jgi:hypothetical protein
LLLAEGDRPDGIRGQQLLSEVGRHVRDAAVVVGRDALLDVLPELRVLIEQPSKQLRLKRPQFAVADGLDVGGAIGTPQQRHLAEEIAAP